MSEKQEKLPAPPEWLKDVGISYTFPQQRDRDAACLVLADLNYDSQLHAIQKLVSHQRKLDETLEGEIKESAIYAKTQTGIYNDRAVDEWINHCHDSVYQSASHSMSALGMLAPFIESVFYHAFQGIGKQTTGKLASNNHERWQLGSKDQWDCHLVGKNGKCQKNLVLGILQLTSAVELSAFMPNDLQPTLEALFAYRNKMFHCGFEWPIKERRNFAARLSMEQWPATWFEDATDRGNPWIFYLSDTFIDHCLEIIESVIVGIGSYCNRKLLPGKKKCQNSDVTVPTIR